MREVQSISAAAQQNFKGISDEIVELSKKVPDSAEQLAKAYYQIVSAGYDGTQGMKLLAAASKGAVAGVTDTQTAADGLTTVLNAWKIDAEDATKVSDIFFATVKAGKTTFGELASGISEVAPLAASFGIAFEEVSAAIATLTKQGAPTSQAITQIRAAIIALNDNLGDGWSKTMTFQEAVAQLRKQAGESETELKNMIGRVEGLNAVLGLTGDNAITAAEDYKTMTSSLGASEQAFQRLSEAADTNLKILGNILKARLKPLGDGIMNVLNQMAGGLINVFSDTKDSITTITGAALQESMKLNKLFEFAKKAATGTDQRRDAINSINKIYGDYLDNLLTEKSTLEDIQGAQSQATKGMIASTIVKQSDEQISQVLGEYQSARDKNLEDIVDQYADAYGSESLGFFIQEFDKAIQKSIETGDYQRKMTSSRVFSDFYQDQLLKIDYGFLDFSKWDKQFKEIAKSYVDMNEEVEKINALSNPYRELVDKIMKDASEAGGGAGGGGGGGLKGAIDLDSLKNQMAEAKQAYEEMAKLREAGSLKFVESEYEELLKLGRTWQEYLTGLSIQFSNSKEAMMLILLETADYDAGRKKIKEQFEKDLNDFAQNIPMLKLETDVIVGFDKKSAKETKKAVEVFGKELSEGEFNKLLGDVYSMSNAFYSMGDFFSGFNDELSEVFMTASNISGQVGSLIQSFESGNTFDIASGFIGIFGQIISLFDDKTTSANIYKKALEEITRELELQKRIIKESERKGGEREALEEEARIREKNAERAKRAYDDYLAYIERWKEKHGPYLDFHEKESLEGLLRNLNELKIAWEDAVYEQEQAEQELKDFGAGLITEIDIADKIAQAFEEGKTSVEDFAEFTNDLLRSAVLESFKASILGPAITKAQEYLSAAMDDGELTSQEIDHWNELVRSAVEEGRDIWAMLTEAAPDLFGGMADTANSLTGAIRAQLTEETGSLLAGRMNIMSLDVRRLVDISLISMDHLNAIEQNTKFNRHLSRLENIESKLNSLDNISS